MLCLRNWSSFPVFERLADVVGVCVGGSSSSARLRLAWGLGLAESGWDWVDPEADSVEEGILLTLAGVLGMSVFCGLFDGVGLAGRDEDPAAGEDESPSTSIVVPSRSLLAD